jgi:hypothetical protein
VTIIAKIGGSVFPAIVLSTERAAARFVLPMSFRL